MRLSPSPKRKRSGARLFEAEQEPQQRALAAAAAPDNGDEFAGAHIQIDAVEHLIVAEGFSQALNVDRQAAHGWLRPAASRPPAQRMSTPRRTRRRCAIVLMFASLFLECRVPGQAEALQARAPRCRRPCRAARRSGCRARRRRSAGIRAPASPCSRCRRRRRWSRRRSG